MGSHIPTFTGIRKAIDHGIHGIHGIHRIQNTEYNKTGSDSNYLGIVDMMRPFDVGEPGGAFASLLC